MTAQGWAKDDCPAIYAKIKAAEILVPGTPIWIGEAGPGPSCLDEGSGGLENEFTQRNTTFMIWNLLHTAHSNQRSEWDAGCRFDYPNPEYR
jgi:hypothetical protein